jgi:hypothetical protein
MPLSRSPTARLRPCWVTHAECGFLGDAQNVHAAGAEVDREQHVHRSKPDRLRSEQVEGQDPLRLGPEELAPGRTVWPGSRPQPVRPQQRANLRRGDPDAELGELAPDSQVAPPRVLPSHPQDELSNLAWNRWPAAGGPPPEGPPPPHELPGHRRSICEVTRNDDHRARGRVQLIAAMNSRSRRRRRGLPNWRLRTNSWWRRTTSSTSVLNCSFEEPAINRNTWRSKGIRERRARTEPLQRRRPTSTPASVGTSPCTVDLPRELARGAELGFRPVGR